VVLAESRRIVRMDQGHLIVETRHGFVCANAGVDESNSLDANTVILLPVDPDASAERLRAALRERFGHDLAVVISDTFGRPWREGLVEVAIGAAGMLPLLDLRGSHDLTGRELHHTVVAVADELAAAAGLIMEKDSGVPAVAVRGYRYRAGRGRAAELVRDPAKDLFR
jgi:coenzyme F420-0:L-glutamate ligase/coenzyme F420-1:gamma-L-glutamate ligase